MNDKSESMLSPELQKKVEELNILMEKRVSEAIKKRGLKDYEIVKMRVNYSYEPREGGYPRSSGGGGVVMVVFNEGDNNKWIAWMPLIRLEIEGLDRNDAIMNMMSLNEIVKEFSNNTVRNKVKELLTRGKKK